MGGLDILLVKPGSQKRLYGTLSDFALTGIEPPLWAALLAGWLRGQGYGVEILDAEVSGLSPEEAAAAVAEARPRLAAVVVSGTNPSASTMNLTGAGRILSAVKRLAPRMPTLLAGLHPSALPEKTLREEAADFVCQGEGFLTLRDLIEALKNGADRFPIPGLWHWEGERVVSRPPPELIGDLGTLPPPAWNLLPMEAYRAHNWHCFDEIARRQPYAVIYTSLGCPFRCSFCCINALFGRRTIRYRPPEQVVAEIDLLVNRFGIRNIKIVDEMFALNERRVVDLCERIAERGYDLNMWAYARVNTVTGPMLAAMKKAGIHWAAYGFESGDREVLAGVTKGYREGDVDHAVRMTREAGMYIIGNFMFGLPEDDHASMERTLALAQDLNCEFVNFNCTMAYPGSQLYGEAVEKGWRLPDTWEGYCQYGIESLPLATRQISAAEVLRFRDEAFRTYFSSRRYLDMVAARFGPSIAKHIRQMTVHRLERRFA